MMDSKAIQFFKNLMSPNKNLRNNAEKEFDLLKTKQFNETFPIFQEGIQYPEKLICQFATLMLKKAYLDDKEIRDKLSKEDIENIRNFIEGQITFNNQEWNTLKRFGEVLAMIYHLDSEKNYHLTEIMQIFNKNDIFGRKLTLFIISNLSDLGVLNDEFVGKNSNDFIQIFNITINDKENEVKSSAIIAFNKLIVNLRDENTQKLFSKLINPMLSNILNLFNEKKEIEKEIFDTLIVLVDGYPKFFIENLNELIEFVCKISSEKNIEFNIRSSSLEIIYSLAHSIPAKIRGSKSFLGTFIPLIFNLLLEIDNIDSIENWAKIKEEDESDLQFMFYHLKSGLERISLDLGGQFFFNCIYNYINNFLNSKNWVEIHGGFAALAFITESAKDIYKEKLKDILQYISMGLINENPRIRYMSLVLLGNILTETAPKPQKEYGNNILPAIVKLLNNENINKVKSMVCLTLNNFLAGLISKNKNSENNIEILKPYINQLVDFILKIFEESITVGYEPLQKNSLECISLLSNIHERNFEEYYPRIMSGLKKLYFGIKAQTSEQKQLKTNCINTIGYLFSSISDDYEKYKEDFIVISQAFINDLKELPIEDPQVIAIIEAFVNISLGINFDDFSILFKDLFLFLEKFISADIGLTMKDAEVDEYVPPEEQKGIGSVVFNFGVKSKKISVNTFALQLKIVSLEALNEIALNLGENFKEYAERYLNLVKNLLTFAYSRKVRKISIKSIYTCCNAYTNDNGRKKVFEFIIIDLLSLLEFDIEAGFFKDMKCIIKYIGKSLSLFEYEIKLDSNTLDKIFSVLKKVLDKVKSKINSLYLLFTNDNDGIYDANDKSDQNSDIFQLQRIYKYVNILLKGFHKLENNNFNKCGQYLKDFYSKLWDEERFYISHNNQKNDKSLEVHENSLAMCINYYNIFMEYSDGQTFINISLDYYPKTESLIELKIGENILGNIAEGYGIICERQDNDLFKKKFNNISIFIQRLLKRNITEENGITHDKAIRALGKYIYYKYSIDSEVNFADKKSLTIDFLRSLPVTYDLEISDKICEEFFDQINEEKCNLLYDGRIIEEVKDAAKKIIELNSKENFIDDLTKLLKTSLALQLNFSHLVE